mgnify:CR=1 FL=1
MDAQGAEEHAQDLVAAYVLDAVTPQEAVLVEEHLATCAACRHLRSALGEIVAQLPALAGEMTPPPRLKARLMAIVAAEAQATEAQGVARPLIAEAPGTRHNGRLPAAPGPLPRQPAGSGHARELISSVRRLGARHVAPLVALAAVLALVIVGAGIWRLTGGRQAPPTAVYTMVGTATQPALAGELRYVADGARLELDLRGLALLPPHRVYELWLIRGHYRVVKGIGTFRPAPDGTIHLTLAGENPSHYTLVCLSVEQTPRARRPTMPLVGVAPIT